MRYISSKVPTPGKIRVARLFQPATLETAYISRDQIKVTFTGLYAESVLHIQLFHLEKFFKSFNK